MNVLVVDDNEDCRMVLAGFIRTIGHNVVECGNGNDALEMISSRVFQLVIADIRMPKFSGMDLLVELSSSPTNDGVHVVLVTGYGDMESAIQALRAGAYDYLLKPIDVRQLATLIKKIEKSLEDSVIKVLLTVKCRYCMEGLKSTLNKSEAHFSILDTNTLDECLTQAKKSKPHIVIVDSLIGAGQETSFFANIRETNIDVKIIVLASNADKLKALDYFKKGANAYLLKNTNINEILHVINKVMDGGQYLDPAVAENFLDEREVKTAISSEYSMLTKQEMKILQLLGQGKTNKEMAKELYLSIGTIKNYLSNILRKLKLRNRSEAIAFTIKNFKQDEIE